MKLRISLSKQNIFLYTIFEDIYVREYKFVNCIYLFTVSVNIKFEPCDLNSSPLNAKQTEILYNEIGNKLYKVCFIL